MAVDARTPKADAVQVDAPPIFKRVLSPMERISEVLFGLIMVLTYTGSLSAATANQASVDTMLMGALGCNLAWGIIDGGMYLMACLQERGRKLLTLQAVRNATDLGVAQQMISDALPALLSPMFPREQLEVVRNKLRQLPEPPARARVTAGDWIGAAGVCVLVFSATLPVVIPFVLVDDVNLASRASNAIAVAMLFLCGYAFGRYAGLRPLVTGGSMVAIGVALVAIAIALGG